MPEPSPFAFSQIAEMNSTPADIPIPELENLRRGLAPAFAPTQQLSGQEETARALEKMRDFQARTVVQGKMSEGAIPPNSMTINSKDGTMDIKGLSVDTYQAIMRDREELNNIRGSFAQEAARLQAQETQARSQPWAQLATALSANLAQAPNLPGWVQAAGRTAAQLNPTADQLRNQRLTVLGQQAQMAEKAGALDIAGLRTENARLQAQLTDADKKALIATKIQDDMTRIEKDASVGARTRGEFDPEMYVKEMVSKGQDPKQAEAAANRLNAIAKVTRTRIEGEAAAKTKSEQDKSKQFYDALAAKADNTDKLIAAANARAEKTGGVKDAAAAAKAAEPSAPLKKQLADLNAADAALDQIEALVTDPANQGLLTGQGPGSGRLASGLASVGADPGGRIAGLKQKFGLQTAQAIKATGAGARGFGPQERPYFEQLAEAITRTPDQNLKVIQGWREFLDVERRGIQISNPDVAANPKYGAVWGKRLSQEQPTVSAPPAGARDAGGPRQKVTKLVYNPATQQVEEK